MKNIKIFILVMVLLSSRAICQIKNLNSYNELIKFQESLKNKNESVIVWGSFGSWGKFGNQHYECNNELDAHVFKKITSSLGFNLFGDSTINCYLPIVQTAKIKSNYKAGDLIKLKIKIYRKCLMQYGSPFFLIEEIF